MINIMSEYVIPIETLDCGMRAAFVNMPHFRTSSARLHVFGGSLHESDQTAGAAHFLEHITFQGTVEFPTLQAFNGFKEERGISANAFTSQWGTAYIANGFELSDVGRTVIQASFQPLLTEVSLDGERKPIIDEIRGLESKPHYRPNIAHQKAMRGERFARPVVGYVPDIRAMTHENLIDFYNRSYHLGNAVLVLCSNETVQTQRSLAQKLTENLPSSSEPVIPYEVDLGSFNPKQRYASLQKLDLPEHAQTSVYVNYDVPTPDNDYDRFLISVVNRSFHAMAFQRLRREMALCYGADASIYSMTNLAHGARQLWTHLNVGAGLDGKDSVKALDAIRQHVLHNKIGEKVLEKTLIPMRRNVDSLLESNPSAIADFVHGFLCQGSAEAIDMQRLKDFSERVTLDQIHRVQTSIVEQIPLVTASSPSESVLEDVGAWAANHQK